MKLWIFITLIAATVNLCIICSACQETDSNEAASLDSQKLDSILKFLARLERKQDELLASFADFKQEARICSPQPKEACANQTLCGEGGDQDQVSEETPTRLARQTPSSKDHRSQPNELATRDNTIPSSSSGWSKADDENNKSKQHLAIGHHYEALFGIALDNLSSSMKDQLASFRATLNKLMSRVVDNSYQYHFILNKLSLIRDECSLAASLGLAERAAESQQARSRPADTTMTHTVRSSDIALIVRLLSSELSHIITSQPSVVASPTHTSDLTALVNETTALMFDRLSGLIVNETRGLTKRLDEIDSVSKQSALILSKLWQSPLVSAGISRQADRVAVVDVTNSNESPQVGASSKPAQPTRASSRQQPLRWFPGSRVPGQAVEVGPIKATNKRSGSASSSGQTKRKCQSKTNSTRPASCQELRQAGANCTGQYYVFVRGSIRHVYCDMNMDSQDDGGGWTVVLRRIDKSLGGFMPSDDDESQQVGSAGRQVNPLMEAYKAAQLDFRLDWSNYRAGFGQLNDWAEFFVGLDMLHQLSGQDHNVGKQQQQHERAEGGSELQADLEFSSGERLHMKFENFSVGNEDSKFEMRLSGCNATESGVCQPLTQLHGSHFYAQDNLTQAEVETLHPLARESLSAGAGWWIPSGSGSIPLDRWLPLTMPIGVLSAGNSTSARHIYWPGYSRDPLRRIILKVRTKRTGRRR